MCGVCSACIGLKVVLCTICFIIFYFLVIRKIDLKINPWQKYRILEYSNDNGKKYYVLTWIRKKFGIFNCSINKAEEYHWDNLEDANWYKDHATKPATYHTDEYSSYWRFTLDGIRISDVNWTEKNKWKDLQHKLNDIRWTAKYAD